VKKFLTKIALFTLLIYGISWLVYAALYKFERDYYKEGMKTRWIMNLRDQHVDYLFLGSSRMANTVAGHQLDSTLNTKSLNIATAGSSYGENYVLFDEFLKNGNTTKTLVLSLDLFKSRHHDYDKEKITTLVFKKFDLFPLYANDTVKEVYRAYSKEINLLLWDIIPFSRYAEYNSYFKFNDLMKYSKGEIYPTSFDTISGEQLVQYYKFKGDRRANPEVVQLGPRGEKYLLAILDLAQQHRIKIILVTAPYYKMYELNREYHNSYVAFLKKKYSTEYIDFSVRQEWKDKNNFSDAIHTNARGSRIFTKELADSLKLNRHD
jgi:hypothetical protein